MDDGDPNHSPEVQARFQGPRREPSTPHVLRALTTQGTPRIGSTALRAVAKPLFKLTQTPRTDLRALSRALVREDNERIALYTSTRHSVVGKYDILDEEDEEEVARDTPDTVTSLYPPVLADEASNSLSPPGSHVSLMPPQLSPPASLPVIGTVNEVVTTLPNAPSNVEVYAERETVSESLFEDVEAQILEPRHAEQDSVAPIPQTSSQAFPASPRVSSITEDATESADEVPPISDIPQRQSRLAQKPDRIRGYTAPQGISDSFHISFDGESHDYDDDTERSFTPDVSRRTILNRSTHTALDDIAEVSVSLDSPPHSVRPDASSRTFLYDEDGVPHISVSIDDITQRTRGDGINEEFPAEDGDIEELPTEYPGHTEVLKQLPDDGYQVYDEGGADDFDDYQPYDYRDDYGDAEDVYDEGLSDIDPPSDRDSTVIHISREPETDDGSSGDRSSPQLAPLKFQTSEVPDYGHSPRNESSFSISHHAVNPYDETLPVISVKSRVQRRAPVQKRKPRQGPRQAPTPSTVPRKIVRDILKTIAKTRIGPAGFESIIQASEQFFQQAGKDLVAYAAHGKRNLIDPSDVIQLMRRQRVINENITAFSLAHQYLPGELTAEMYPLAKMVYEKLNDTDDVIFDDITVNETTYASVAERERAYGGSRDQDTEDEETDSNDSQDSEVEFGMSENDT